MAVPEWIFDPILYTSNAGKNMRTHVRETSFAALTDSKLNCAVSTPKKIVRSTETEASMAPTKGTTSSDESTPMMFCIKDARDGMERREGKTKARERQAPYAEA